MTNSRGNYDGNSTTIDRLHARFAYFTGGNVLGRRDGPEALVAEARRPLDAERAAAGGAGDDEDGEDAQEGDVRGRRGDLCGNQIFNPTSM